MNKVEVDCPGLLYNATTIADSVLDVFLTNPVVRLLPPGPGGLLEFHLSGPHSVQQEERG